MDEHDPAAVGIPGWIWVVIVLTLIGVITLLVLKYERRDDNYGRSRRRHRSHRSSRRHRRHRHRDRDSE